jgi:hypothetical protein
MKALLLDFRYAPRRISVVLLGIFGTIALLPAAVRMALGARRDILRLVVRHALKRADPVLALDYNI